MTDMAYSRQAQLIQAISRLVREFVFVLGIHPDYLILEIIREIYGHQVELSSLSELIEGSPVIETN